MEEVTESPVLRQKPWLWQGVRGGGRRGVGVTGRPHTLTLFLSLAFLSSIHLAWTLNGEDDPRGTIGFFCPNYHHSGDAY